MPSTRPPGRRSTTSRIGWRKTSGELHQAERERAGLDARKDALELGLTRKDGAGALLAASDRVRAARLGRRAAAVQPGLRDGGRRGARLGRRRCRRRRDVDAALGAIEHLKAEDLGRAGLCSARPAGPTDATPGPGCPRRALYAVDVVDVPAGAAAGARAAAVQGRGRRRPRRRAGAGRRRCRRHAVTRDGDLLGAHFAAGGSSSQPSLIEVQAAVDEAADQLAEADARAASGCGSTCRGSRPSGSRRSAGSTSALAKLHESDADAGRRRRGARPARLAGPVRRGRGRPARRRRSRAEEARDRDLAGLAELEERLAAAETRLRRGAGHRRARAARRARPAAAPAGRDGRPARAAHRRGAGPGAARAGRRPAARGARRAGGPGRGRRPARAAAPRGPGRPRRSARRRRSLARLEQSLDRRPPRSARGRAGADRARAGADRGPRPLRDLARELDELVNTVHRDEMARTQQRMRIEQLEERASRSSVSTPTRWWPTTAPTSPCPPTAGRRATAGADEAAGARAGAVRPRGAAEAAADGRAGAGDARQGQPAGAGGVRRAGGAAPVPHRAARGPQGAPARDLLDIVREVDERVEQVFTEAYADVDARVRRVFARLFPGGEGRLVLTDPDDMLDHRHRGRGPPAGQEDQAALAAVRRRALAGRGGVPGRAVQGPARRRSTSSTRSRPRSTTPTSAGCWRSTRSCARTASCW